MKESFQMENERDGAIAKLFRCNDCAISAFAPCILPPLAFSKFVNTHDALSLLVFGSVVVVASSIAYIKVHSHFVAAQHTLTHRHQFKRMKKM